jgi:acyl-CoA hydrolase
VSTGPREAGRATRLIDIVFPGDTNHHGTLFGGIGLAQMDKVAFITASRHAHVDFVTGSCERIDFKAPANIGEIIELAGRVTQVGRRSLRTEVELVAEAPLTGERRLCARGAFNMVAVGERVGPAYRLPPLADEAEDTAGTIRMVEMVFPGQTSHYGSLYGGDALTAMARAAFVAATRHCREHVVMKLAQRADFRHQVVEGEVIELIPAVVSTGRSAMTVTVAMWAENLQTGERRDCGAGEFVMVAVDENGQSKPIGARAVAGGTD